MAKKHAPGFLKISLEAKRQVEELAVEQVKAAIDTGEDFTLMDVREDHEWAGGHIPTAMHLGRGIVERDVEKTITDFDRRIVCYCGGGFRSAMVAMNLGKMGYTNVASMDGGYSGWCEAGYATQAPDQ